MNLPYDLKNLYKKDEFTLKDKITLVISALGAFAVISAMTNYHIYSRMKNAVFGSGKCYEREVVRTRQGDTYWGLTKNIDARDREIIIKLMRSENIFRGFTDKNIPIDIDIHTFKEADCSKVSKSLDSYIKEANIFFTWE